MASPLTIAAGGSGVAVGVGGVTDGSGETNGVSVNPTWLAVLVGWGLLLLQADKSIGVMQIPINMASHRRTLIGLIIPVIPLHLPG